MRTISYMHGAAPVVVILACQGCIDPARTRDDGWAYRLVVPAFDHAPIKRITVLEFEGKRSESYGGFSAAPEIGKPVSDIVEEQLVFDSPYQVVSRTELGRILQEHDLSVQGIVQAEGLSKLASIASVDAIVVGHATEMGEHLGVRLKLLDVKSGEVAFTASEMLGRQRTRSQYEAIWGKVGYTESFNILYVDKGWRTWSPMGALVKGLYPHVEWRRVAVSDDASRQCCRLGVTMKRTAEGHGVKAVPLSHDSPAQRAGICPGDVIVEFDGRSVINEIDIMEALLAHNPGDMVEVVIMREGERLLHTVVLAARESTVPEG